MQNINITSKKIIKDLLITTRFCRTIKNQFVVEAAYVARYFVPDRHTIIPSIVFQTSFTPRASTMTAIR